MLIDDGERMLPDSSDGNTFWEHVQRYRFAAGYAAGQRVLDIACGEGYGTAALHDAGAASVIGVDLSEEVCAHARARYGVDARAGDATSIPVGDGEVDLIVSFETLEHLYAPDAFLAECSRVLSARGRLIISTPNRPVYCQRTPDNPFHHRELDADEFNQLLVGGFEPIDYYGQYLPLPRLLQQRYWRRLPYLWHQLAAPHALIAPRPQDRAGVRRLINQTPCWRDRFDPFGVRRMSKARLRRACFLIAVAERR